jgi:transposase InsO family protein
VYAYIASGQHQQPVRRLCAVLGVCPSAYYAWQIRRRTAGRVPAVETAVVRAFTAHAARYGTRRLQHELRAQGHRLGRARIACVLRRHGLRAQQPRAFVPQTTDSGHGRRVAPNRLLDRPAPTAPDQVWVGDITYLPRQGGGWFYLAVWLDRYSRRVVGWDVRPTMPADLVCEALRRALVVRQPAPGLLVHSDQGSQYTADDFGQLLRGHHAVASMSRQGNCYDNAHAESFWSRLKTELLAGGSFPDLETARLEISHYIAYYNLVRRHSALDYQAPATFETQSATTSQLCPA